MNSTFTGITGFGSLGAATAVELGLVCGLSSPNALVGDPVRPNTGWIPAYGRGNDRHSLAALFASASPLPSSGSSAASSGGAGAAGGASGGGKTGSLFRALVRRLNLSGSEDAASVIRGIERHLSPGGVGSAVEWLRYVKIAGEEIARIPCGEFRMPLEDVVLVIHFLANAGDSAAEAIAKTDPETDINNSFCSLLTAASKTESALAEKGTFPRDIMILLADIYSVIARRGRYYYAMQTGPMHSGEAIFMTVLRLLDVERRYETLGLAGAADYIHDFLRYVIARHELDFGAANVSKWALQKLHDSLTRSLEAAPNDETKFAGATKEIGDAHDRMIAGLYLFSPTVYLDFSRMVAQRLPRFAQILMRRAAREFAIARKLGLIAR